MAKKKTPASGTPALRLLEDARVIYRVHGYDHDPVETNFGAEAARLLGVSADRIFKTLVVIVDGSPVVAVVPVPGKLNLKALASALGGKRAEMAPAELAERKTGYLIGGISPLGQKTRLPLVLDSEAWAHETIFISAGRRGLDVELSPEDLARMTGARRASIGR